MTSFIRKFEVPLHKLQFCDATDWGGRSSCSTCSLSLVILANSLSADARHSLSRGGSLGDTNRLRCLKSLPVCGGCETPPRAWGVSQLGYDERPKNRLKRCVVHAVCAQSSQRIPYIQSLRAGVYYCLHMLCDWQMISESYSKYFDTVTVLTNHNSLFWPSLVYTQGI